jgi:hypothetical protein
VADRSCLDSVELREFALGHGNTAQFDSLASHVEGCSECQQRLEELDGATDDLVERLGRLRVGSDADTNGGDLWSQAIIASVSTSGHIRSRIAADVGRDLARRLGEGPVQLDRFELRTELGVGSFGYVFQAWDPRLQRVVALKVQRAGSLASQEEVERFLREARSAAQLKHPSIVSMYETAKTEDNVWFLVCEYVDGINLEQRLKDGPLPPGYAADIVSELADALQYAHEQGVVHRDVKPSNIIIDRHERAHLMDFGLAKRDRARRSAICAVSRVVVPAVGCRRAGSGRRIAGCVRRRRGPSQPLSQRRTWRYLSRMAFDDCAEQSSRPLSPPSQRACRDRRHRSRAPHAADFGP